MDKGYYLISALWFDFDCQQIGHNVQQLCNADEKDGDGDEAV